MSSYHDPKNATDSVAEVMPQQTQPDAQQELGNPVGSENTSTVSFHSIRDPDDLPHHEEGSVTANAVGTATNATGVDDNNAINATALPGEAIMEANAPATSLFENHKRNFHLIEKLWTNLHPDSYLVRWLTAQKVVKPSAMNDPVHDILLGLSEESRSDLDALLSSIIGSPSSIKLDLAVFPAPRQSQSFCGYLKEMLVFLNQSVDNTFVQGFCDGSPTQSWCNTQGIPNVFEWLRAKPSLMTAVNYKKANGTNLSESIFEDMIPFALMEQACQVFNIRQYRNHCQSLQPFPKYPLGITCDVVRAWWKLIEKECSSTRDESISSDERNTSPQDNVDRQADQSNPDDEAAKQRTLLERGVSGVKSVLSQLGSYAGVTRPPPTAAHSHDALPLALTPREVHVDAGHHSAEGTACWHWLEAAIRRQERTQIVLDYMNKNCNSPIPQTSVFGSRQIAPATKAALTELLSRTSVQRWYSQKSSPSSFFERNFRTWMRDCGVSYIFKDGVNGRNLCDIIDKISAKSEYDPYCIDDVLKWATYNDNATRSRVTFLACTVEFRSETHPRIKAHISSLATRSEVAPMLVLQGLVFPLLQKGYPNGTFVDDFVCEIVYFGTWDARPEAQDVYTLANNMLEKSILHDTERAMRLKHINITWSKLIAMVKANTKVVSQEWCAQRFPLELLTHNQHLKINLSVPPFDALHLAYRSLVEPKSLSKQNLLHLSDELVAILMQRVPQASISTVNVAALFQTVANDFERQKRCFRLVCDFCTALPNSSLKYWLQKEHVFEPTLPALDVPFQSYSIFRHPVLDVLLANRNNSERGIEILEKVLEQIKNNSVDVYSEKIRYTPSSHFDFVAILRDLLYHLENLVDGKSIRDLLELGAEWCGRKGIPRLVDWCEARLELRKFLRVVEQRHGDNAVLTQTPLFFMLRNAVELTTGKTYREFDQQLMKRYHRVLPLGITKQVVAQWLAYCSPEKIKVREFRETNMQSLKRLLAQRANDNHTKAWSDGESKSILAASNILIATMPRRLKENERPDGFFSQDTYNFDDFCRGVSEAHQRHSTILEVLTPDNVIRLTALHEAFQQSGLGQSNMNDLSSVIADGCFECQTSECYDSPDGVARSHWISQRHPTKKTHEVKRLDADLTSTILAEIGVSKATRTEDEERFANIVPTLTRLVEVGIYSLSRGYREFVSSASKKFPRLSKEIDLKHHEINGRHTGFRFCAKLSTIGPNVGQLSYPALSDLIRDIASECENFVCSIEAQRIVSPVMKCFDDKEVGFMLSVMLNTMSEIAAKSISQLVSLRLGNVAVDVGDLDGLQGEDFTVRLQKLSQVLAKCREHSNVPMSAPSFVPQVLYVTNADDWPLAVAGVFASHRNLSAFQLCLPIETRSADLFSARESFLRRLHSGAYQLDTTSRLLQKFCLVVPEIVSDTSDTFSLLKEECRASSVQLVVIVNSKLISIDGRSLFSDHTASRAPLSNALFFDPSVSQIGAVIGPSRSGKMMKSINYARKVLKKDTTITVKPCLRFLSGATTPHDLHNMLEDLGDTGSVVIIEIGTGISHQLQALIFSLCLRSWASRDGTCVHRTNPVILKVHSRLEQQLPVFQLLHCDRSATATRPEATLKHQFEILAKSMLPALGSNSKLLRVISSCGDKLSLASVVPLTSKSWHSIHDPKNNVELKKMKTSSELPEFLITFNNAKRSCPLVSCVDEELTQNVVEGLDYCGNAIPCHYLDKKSSADLWRFAFDVLCTPSSLRIVPGLVMTPSILQSLIRLDLSVRARQHCKKREDDGVVTFVGETGSGKTQLVSTYCCYRGWGAPTVIHVNTGTTAADIINQVRDLKNSSEKVFNDPTPKIIFFDEFNTSPVQDIIKRIMLDRILPDGTCLPSTHDGWIFIAACNPYAVLHEGGRDGRVVLKYTVQPEVSPSLVDSCWRLPLPTEAEESSIVASMCAKCNVSEDDTNYFVKTIPRVHKYLASKADAIPFSLRTVSRLLRLYRHLDLITCLDAIADETVQCKHTAAVGVEVSEPSIPSSHLAPLALAVNYYVALPQKKRDVLEAELKRIAARDVSLSGALDHFGEKLRTLYETCTGAVKDALPTLLYRETSLNETLAVTYLCVYSQTPLILIGPPGSSKTLATFMIAWGQVQKAFSHLKSIELPLYFQCSNRTSPHSIQKAMADANAQQAKGSVFVHVFDEIGNADQAPGHPLRVLNEYLERSVFQQDGTPEDISPQAETDHVAFIGTSNYNLDRSLLGRAIILQRDIPTKKELLSMFPPKSNKEFVESIHKELLDVEVMQSQQSYFAGGNIYHNKLTMRDIYALLSETNNPTKCLTVDCPCEGLPGRNAYCCAECEGGVPCQTKVHTRSNGTQAPKAMELISTANNPNSNNVVRIAILKSMGNRGERILGNVSEVTRTNIQLLLLQRRCETIRACLAAHQPSHGDSEAPQHQPQRFHQSPQRPLLIAADQLCTVMAALDAQHLKEHCDIIYGKHLVFDEQMVTTTMLQLRSAMMTPGRVCILVDCEPLIDNLLDVFNGFYQQEGGSHLTVRVVLDGRSAFWPVTADFNTRCVLVTIDSTSQFRSFTPAGESRFEKVYLTSNMYTTRYSSFDKAAKTYQQEELGLDTPPHLGIQGYHPLMMAAFHHQQQQFGASIEPMYRLLAKPAALKKSHQDAQSVLSRICSLVKRQNLSSVIDRFLSSSLHSLVLCPVNIKNTNSRELQTLSNAKALLEHVKQEFKVRKVEAQSLALRSATPDMLLDIAVKNIMASARDVVVFAISNSSSHPITASNLLAVCHFIATVASDYRIKVLMFAPCISSQSLNADHSVSQLTVPPDWSVSFCEEVLPEPLNAGQSQRIARLRYINVVNSTVPDVFVGSDVKCEFDDHVRRSIADVCLNHLKKRCEGETISTCCAVEEVLEYQRIIIDLRWELSLHFSNHNVLIRNKKNLNAGWTAMSNSLLLNGEKLVRPMFLLSPARAGGLPAVQCVGDPFTTVDHRVISQIDAIYNTLKTSSSSNASIGGLELQKGVTLARLCGCHSDIEIIAVVRLHSAFPTRFPLPLSPHQLALLRQFMFFTPRNVRLNNEKGYDDPPSLDREHVVEFLESSSSSDTKTHAVAFAKVCNSVFLNRVRRSSSIFPSHVNVASSDPLRDPNFSNTQPSEPLKIRPTECDIFVRLALTFSVELAKTIFLSEAFRIDASAVTDEYPASFVQKGICMRDQMECASHQRQALVALERYFGVKSEVSSGLPPPQPDNSDELEPSLEGPTSTENKMQLDVLKVLRNRLFEIERQCGLPLLGHYVHLYRVMREQLLITEPALSSASSPKTPHQNPAPRADEKEKLFGACTLEMMQSLTIGCLPSTLRQYVQKFLRSDQFATDDTQVLDVYNLLAKRIRKLIMYHNDYLLECDALIVGHVSSTSRRQRTFLDWPLLTVHHQIVCTELLDEILTTDHSDALSAWCHLEEALVGIPILSVEHFPLIPSDQHYLDPVFHSEPRPSEIFPE
ncbi:Hypothetical protein, putative [Bodo saltans]|uniref:AAA+ ATPase domain-containing protein n=1 Tax=Bodo saltans TaxID=75058 RepID=A0A0S4JA48_BODSA|nr:Hypothetical protein, putative [Bodo saltans]|eukprot:CUG86992.1 Hypothetical protein, putative [Bodo saltans]